MAKASFYNNFKSKDDLIVACLHESEIQLTKLLESNKEALGTPTIESWVQSVDSWLRRHNHRTLHLIAIIEFPDLGHPVHAEVCQFKGRMLEQVAAILREGNFDEPERVAMELIQTIDGSQIATLYGTGVEGFMMTATDKLLTREREKEAAKAPPKQCTLCGRPLKNCCTNLGWGLNSQSNERPSAMDCLGNMLDSNACYRHIRNEFSQQKAEDWDIVALKKKFGWNVVDQLFTYGVLTTRQDRAELAFKTLGTHARWILDSTKTRAMSINELHQIFDKKSIAYMQRVLVFLRDFKLIAPQGNGS